MKLSEYIAQLQSILEAEGDLPVVRSGQRAAACSRGFEFGKVTQPTVCRVGDYFGAILIMHGDQHDVIEIGRVVCVGGREPLVPCKVPSFTARSGEID
jgi:hypothetical protein